MSEKRASSLKSIVLSLIFLTLLLPSGGCVVVALGAGAGVGYEVAKDDRTIGTKLTDAAITTAVKSELIADSTIPARDINVDTYEGVVSLYGKVPSAAAQSRAATLAERVDGVITVESHPVVVSLR